MHKPLITVIAASLLAAGLAHAQMQPYGAFKDREIKALSTDDIANLRAGRGMGMALPAELNRYPGPAHALENAAALGLTSEQKVMLSGQFDTMHSEAVALGERIIAREIALNRLFQAGSADAASIDRLTAELGAL